MDQLAINRLKDYLMFKGIPIPNGNIIWVDLRSIGLDDTDMATLIGEIQCDLLRVVDWEKPVHRWCCLADILHNLTDQTFFNAGDLQEHLCDLWPSDEKAELAMLAGELEWPS